MSTGLFNSSNFVAENTKPSFADAITHIMPNGDAPMFALSSQLAKATAINPEHAYWTKTMLFQSLTIAVDLTNVATTVTVGSTADIVAGMLFMVDSGNGENILVVSVDSSTVLTIARGIGTVAAAAALTGVKMYLIGNANEEGSTRPTAVKIAEVKVNNYTQIFRNAWSITGTAAAVQKFIGETPVADNEQDCAKFHARDIEFSIMFSQKYSGTRNGKPFRTMEGFVDNCRANSRITAMGGTTTYDQLEAALDPVFDSNSDPAIGNKRVMFVGGTARMTLNNIGRKYGTYQMVDGQTSFGLQFTTFRTSRGEFSMIEHPLFNTNATFKKYALVLDMGGVRLPYLGGRETKPENYSLDASGNVQVGDSGLDAIGGSLLSELTLETRNSFANKLLTNLTAAA